MSNHELMTPVLVPVTEQYRALIFAIGGVAVSAMLALTEALTPGRPFGGLEIVTVLVAVVTAAGVYFVANPWAKFAGGLAGAVGQTLIASVTDNHVTVAEMLVVGIAILSALGIGAFPNAPQEIIAAEEPADFGPGHD